MDFGASHSSDRSPHVKLSSAEMIKFRDERKSLRFTLTNGQILEGAVRWFDDDSVHVLTGEREEMTVFKHAILYYSTL